MKVVEGAFGKKDEGPITIPTFISENKLEEVEFDGFVFMGETPDGRMVTLCYPSMSGIEILGCLDLNAQVLRMAMMEEQV